MVAIGRGRPLRSTWRIEGPSGGANLVPQPGAIPGIVAANGASPTGGRHRERPAIEEYMAHRRVVRRRKLGATTGRDSRHRGSKWSLTDGWSPLGEAGH